MVPRPLLRCPTNQRLSPSTPISRPLQSLQRVLRDQARGNGPIEGGLKADAGYPDRAVAPADEVARPLMLPRLPHLVQPAVDHRMGKLGDGHVSKGIGKGDEDTGSPFKGGWVPMVGDMAEVEFTDDPDGVGILGLIGGR